MKHSIKNERVFELAWTWHEDYTPYLFYHPTKTKDEFNSDVKLMLIKYGNEYIASETSWVGASRWIEYVANKMPELGYKQINPKAFHFFGAYIIKGDDDDDKEWCKIVGKKLLNKAIKHNKTLEEKLEKDRI